MPEQLTDDLLDLRDTATTLATGPLTVLATRAREEQLDRATLRSDVVRASTEAGIFAMTQDSPSTLAIVVVREALGRHDVGHLPGIFGPTAGLLANVDEPLRSQYLEPMLAGEKTGAFGFTEPAGAERHTWATVDGDELVINGAKSYVTGGGDADFVNTLVEVDGTGPAMVLIDTGAPGVSITRRFESLDGSHHAAFSFTDVRVPASQVIGGTGTGMRRAVEQVNRVRMAIAADCVGSCGFVLDHVATHLQAPRSKGGPLGESERHRLRFGQMRIAAYAARSTLYRTARLVDGGAENPINEIIATKYLATETIGDLVDTAIQTVGGQALTDGHPLVAILRRVRSLRLAEGASDVLAMNAARGWLDLGFDRI